MSRIVRLLFDSLDVDQFVELLVQIYEYKGKGDRPCDGPQNGYGSKHQARALDRASLTASL